MAAPTVIHWFRQDLRLADNPALTAAAQAGNILPVFILDEVTAGLAKKGAASRLWLHHSLESLNASLGGGLRCYQGESASILFDLVERHDIDSVFWNRCYEPWRIARDTSIKAELQNRGVNAVSKNGSLLWEPNQIANKAGKPYKVFTPFYKAARLVAQPREPLPTPSGLRTSVGEFEACSIDSLGLKPERSWGDRVLQRWQIGEEAAHEALASFLDQRMDAYQEKRDVPAVQATSLLSPRLAFGELSPNQVWYGASDSAPTNGQQTFLKEVGWREFSYSLLFHFPNLSTDNFQPKFDSFSWGSDEALLQRWRRGVTGYPLIDAGMRELWQTGYMHNRVRMIVGSFLVKNLLQHWRHGYDWFWDCLLDADMANNAASWQWVAGCGADAAPYFRIFNPVTQGKKFDPKGEYVKTYVPELAALPGSHIHNPWDAPEAILAGAGVTLGGSYPFPIVDLKASRSRALDAFSDLKAVS